MIGTSGCQLSPPLGVEPPPENSRWSRSFPNRLPALLDRTSRTSTALARYELHSSRREGHKGRPNSSANQVRICGISDWIELQVADAPRAQHPGRLMTKSVANCNLFPARLGTAIAPPLHSNSMIQCSLAHHLQQPTKNVQTLAMRCSLRSPTQPSPAVSTKYSPLWLAKSLLLVTCVSCRVSNRSEEHTSELQSRLHLVCRLLLEKKKNN